MNYLSIIHRSGIMKKYKL